MNETAIETIPLNKVRYHLRLRIPTELNLSDRARTVWFYLYSRHFYDSSTKTYGGTNVGSKRIQEDLSKNGQRGWNETSISHAMTELRRKGFLITTRKGKSNNWEKLCVLPKKIAEEYKAQEKTRSKPPDPEGEQPSPAADARGGEDLAGKTRPSGPGDDFDLANSNFDLEEISQDLGSGTRSGTNQVHFNSDINVPEVQAAAEKEILESDRLEFLVRRFGAKAVELARSECQLSGSPADVRNIQKILYRHRGGHGDSWTELRKYLSGRISPGSLTEIEQAFRQEERGVFVFSDNLPEHIKELLRRGCERVFFEPEEGAQAEFWKTRTQLHA